MLADEAARLNRAWTFAVEHGRPFVTWKLATTLDGRSAAADGTSRWISSEPARQDTHRLRAECDVLMVGTGTVEVDDPLLTVRDDWDRPVRHQPLRAVMGLRDLAPDRRILNNHAETVHLRTHEPGRGAGATSTTGAAPRLARGRPHPRGRLPRPPASWTRSSPTSRRACWAPVRARWATWASPRSTTSSACASGRPRSSAPAPTQTSG